MDACGHMQRAGCKRVGRPPPQSPPRNPCHAPRVSHPFQARGRSLGVAPDGTPVSDGAAIVVAALRWIASQPRVGGARIGAALLSLDATQAVERLVMRRLLVLQQLLRVAATSTGGGITGGMDPRLVPLPQATRFLSDVYTRKESRLRAAALRTTVLLLDSAARSSAADVRAVQQLLKVGARLTGRVASPRGVAAWRQRLPRLPIRPAASSLSRPRLIAPSSLFAPSSIRPLV